MIDLKKVAEDADMIVNGDAFTQCDDRIKVSILL